MGKLHSEELILEVNHKKGTWNDKEGRDSSNQEISRPRLPYNRKTKWAIFIQHTFLYSCIVYVW